ncbi:PAS/PAC sensor signal transduction histidine kinase [Halosimplex carlsbadense 2-9-1]|uniref:PAS/PAC sensor signal transduction histidine kinase n=1 Tax=Halosimplex carlsbadense 2-9-1 TaxID=797114 RepID=M0CYZ6_9EURY|nr:PAS domain-containing sensor histidine kinase [Halosimplex carlsbadense]ELZ27858.1 PAS/PAC sensor signal transduction histidine kinase [Halosimplex carlsbadense 2-9-1]
MTASDDDPGDGDPAGGDGSGGRPAGDADDGDPAGDSTGPRDEADEPGVRILHLDPDETVISRLTAATADSEGIDYEGTSDPDRVRERSDAADVDVFVVEPDAPADVAALVEDAGAAGAAVALYTRVDPGDVDPAVLDAADTLVEKWTAEEGLDFVVEKLLRAARTHETASRFARAFDRVDPDTQSSCSSLVYEDGTVIWESTPLDGYFDRRGVTAAVPETPNFYRQLTAALSHDPDAIRTIRGPDVPAEPTEFSVPTDEGRARFRYTEHEFPDTVGPLRLVIVEDVTWSARSSARLELLDLLDQHVQDGISVVDANGRVEYHNESFAGLLGYDDMVGEHTAAYMAEGELQSGQRTLQQLRTDDRDSAVIDMTFETADGEERTLAVHFSVRDDEDGYEGLVNVARDVTERRDRERTLEQYRRLVESAGDPMYVLDDDGRVEICNDALVELFEGDRESVEGTALSELLPQAAAERIDEALDRAGTADESATDGFDIPTATGEVRQFEATVAGLGPADDADGSVGIFHEVTARERRESELDLLKQVLTRVLRHDVRTGLTVVRGQAEVLAERTDGEQRGMAETIVDRSEQLVETTEKARAIERVIDSDEGRVTLDLRSVVNRSVANVAAVHGDAEYDVQITEQVPVRAHRALPYAVENLVENAVKHSCTSPASNAQQDAVSHGDDTPSVTITAAADGEGTVELRITDDGPGISQSELDVLADREETPLKHGTGVGLWLVSWVVDRSGGDLDFDTGDDGTTVTVRLDAGDADDLS